jgi:hypothetical protein
MRYRGLALAIVLVSCAEGRNSRNSGVDSDVEQIIGKASNSEQNAKHLEIMQALQGTWIRRCTSHRNQGEPVQSAIYSIKIEKNKLQKHWQYFSDSNCTVPLYNHSEGHTFVVGNPADYTRKKNAHEIDLTVESYENTPLDPSWVDTLNKNTYWGHSDWEIGKPNNICGRRRMPNFTKAPVKGDLRYNIIALHESSIMIGDTNQIETKGTSPELRPVEFLATAYQKVE